MGDSTYDALTEALLGGDVYTTADVLGRMPKREEPGFWERYIKPLGSASLAKREPNWFGKNVLANPALQDAMLAVNFLSPSVKLPRVANPIKAYHGSPHDFDKFDLSKIGTGEGAQAYGHGLYFAENEGVARAYRDQLRDAPKATGGVRDLVKQTLLGADNDIPAAIARLQSRLEERPFLDAKLNEAHSQSLMAAIKDLEGMNPGRMYEVALHATPEQFLDWDKPLSGQSANVRDAMSPLVGTRLTSLDNTPFVGALSAGDLGRLKQGSAAALRDMKSEAERSIASLQSQIGKAGYDQIGVSGALARQQRRLDALRELESRGLRYEVPDMLASELVEKTYAPGMRAPSGEIESKLAEAGIPGIRYLDQGSRDKAYRVNLTHRGQPYETEPQLFGSREMAERYAAEKKAQGFGADVVNNGTSNYVVWTPEIIEMLRKYGIVAPVAGAGLAEALSAYGPEQ